jgi:GcrA cell cycle regulator
MPVAADKFWNEKRTAEAKELWEGGMSASDIAARIGAASRSSILSKVNRSGWKGPNSWADKPKGSPRPREATTPRTSRSNFKFGRKSDGDKAPAAVVAPSLPEPSEMAAQVFGAAGGRSLLDLRPGDCRWPVGDPAMSEFRFCGAGRISGFSYCADHCRVAYVGPKRR